MVSSTKILIKNQTGLKKVIIITISSTLTKISENSQNKYYCILILIFNALRLTVLS